MEPITAKTPWENQMDQIPMHLDYFEGSMVDKVMQIASEYPNNIAFDFMGRHTTYRQMVREIERCARALKTIGIRENDKVTIGTIHKEARVMPDGSTQIRDVVDIGATLDERIADGFYFARSLKLVKYIFAHPELLDLPLNQPSNFDYNTKL